jgi:hypothetical protein
MEFFRLFLSRAWREVHSIALVVFCLARGAMCARVSFLVCVPLSRTLVRCSIVLSEAFPLPRARGAMVVEALFARSMFLLSLTDARWLSAMNHGNDSRVNRIFLVDVVVNAM